MCRDCLARDRCSCGCERLTLPKAFIPPRGAKLCRSCSHYVRHLPKTVGEFLDRMKR